MLVLSLAKIEAAFLSWLHSLVVVVNKNLIAKFLSLNRLTPDLILCLVFDENDFHNFSFRSKPPNLQPSTGDIPGFDKVKLTAVA